MEEVQNIEESILKTLIVEYLRDTNIAFSTIENEKFRTLLGFLRPGIVLPSYAELIKFNVDNYNVTQPGEPKPRPWRKLKTEPTLRNLLEKEFNIDSLPEVPNDDSKDSEAPESVEGPPKEEVPDSEDSEAPDVVTENLNNDFLLPSPSTFSVSSSPPSTSHSLIAENFKYFQEEPDPVPFSDIQFLPYRYGTRNFFQVKPTPGLVRWPCLVCGLQKKPSEIRDVVNNDAYIIIYLCVKNGQYPMEMAKKLARLQKFKCCKSHFDEMLRSARDHLGVTNPTVDIHEENPRIIDAHLQITKIKDFRYFHEKTYNKVLFSFCDSLRMFFDRYERKFVGLKQ